MPYTKPLTTAPFARMTRLLKGYDMNGVTLGRVLGCSAPTARGKIDNPERLTLGDLDKLRRVGHIPWDEIKEALVR